ncbi:hypothetical protein IHN32_00090 [Deinococcus sp. 14RED07]|uniref:hypothetical protein n=1 Tax=Deinococcus sp. 14RED07 TaxID=2745874 RepID=UPI001E427BED|nr:hypothetical protein [Deinococcus sp. 14RED07]MCD0174356.1 hypothetical protein [Deinococcus sp. 14RED07]
MPNRPHVLTALRDPETAVVSLVAGNGYGKSTHLIALSSDPRHLYIRLSDADPDPISIARVVARVLPPHPNNQLAYELSRSAVTERAAAAALRHDLNLHAPLTLLLDDAETLNNDGRRFFTNLLQLSGIRWIVASTTPEDFPIRTLRLRNVPTQLITDRELALSTDEMRDLGLTEAQMDLTQGWPAAVSLAALGDDPRLVAQELLLTVPDTLIPSLRRASLLKTWRTLDPLNTALNLTEGWLATALAYGVPCTRLDNDSWAPHPIVREELRLQLRDRPSQYASAQRAIAGALQAQQPMAAVEAYLASGEETEARALLERMLPTLRSAEQLSAALPLLQRAAPAPGSPLHVAFAQALFEGGSLVRGLSMAEEALGAGADPASTHALIGQFRYRTGNYELAAQHLQAAITCSTQAPHHALLAQLGLVYAQHAQQLTGEAARGFAQKADEAAYAVLATGDLSEELGSAMVLARVARTLACAVLDARPAARESARLAREAAEVLTPSLDVLTALHQLARYWADDGDLETATQLLALAVSMDTAQRDTALQVAVTRARLYLRHGDADSCAHHATQAAALAEEMHHQPALREALILLTATAVLPVGDATSIRLQRLRDRFGHEPDIHTALAFLDQVFLNPQRRTSGNRLLPLELRALLAVAALRTQTLDITLSSELDFLYRRLGAGVMNSYGQLLQVTIPSLLAGTHNRHTLEVMMLRSVPEIRVNGTALQLQPVLVLPMIILAQRGELALSAAQDVYAPGYRGKPDQNHYKLKAAFKAVTGLTAPLGSERGALTISGWRLRSDLNALSECPFHDLLRLYRAPVYAQHEPTPALTDLRDEARRILAQRLAQWSRVDPDAAEAARVELCTRDPLLISLSHPVGVLAP